MPISSDERRVIDYFNTRTAQLRARVTGAADQLWLRLGSYDEADIARFARQIGSLVDAGWLRTAQLTDLDLARIESVQTGLPVRPFGIGPADVSTEALRGVDARELWRRPGVSVWSGLSEGKPWTEAVEAGRIRTRQLTSTQMQLAKVRTAQTILDGKPIVGYRRVTAGKTCSKCLTAATQRYHRGDLLPIHVSCDCTVYPIFGEDPGRVIDAVAIDEPAGAVLVQHHGELGSVLVEQP